MKIYFIVIIFAISTSVNSQNWDSLKYAFNSPIRAMYSDSIDNYLYVAGIFNSQTIDGRQLKGIARWNGLIWDSLAKGIDGANNAILNNTFAFTRHNNKLFVGGAFASLGNISARCIGSWNGFTWDSLQVQPFKTNTNNAIFDLKNINNELYIAGIFDSVAGVPAKGIAKWNTINWSSLNFPNYQFFTSINAICIYKNKIIVGGNFQSSINDTVGNILAFDGNNWQTLTNGVPILISSMQVYNDELYVAGISYDQNIKNILRWNDTIWKDVGDGTNSQINKLMVFNSKLIALGNFTSAGGINSSKIASWDNTNWCGFGGIYNNSINSGSLYNDTLIIGGAFTQIDNNNINYIAKWIGGNYVDTCGHISVGITETTANNQQPITIYPNPSTGIFTITTNQQIQIIKIYNLIGELIIQTKSQTIDLTDQPNGIYLVQIETDRTTFNQKIIKQ
jgi:hypothetical protein